MKYILFFTLSVFNIFLYSQNFDIPIFTDHVIVLEDAIDGSKEKNIETVFEKFHENTKIEAVFLIMKNIPIDKSMINDYSYKVATKNKLGGKGSNDGMLITLAIEDRIFRVEVGDGLEGYFPDIKIKHLQDKCFVPYFKKEKYVQGLQCFLDEIENELNGKNISVYKKFVEQNRQAHIKEVKERRQKVWLFFVDLMLFGGLLGVVVLIFWYFWKKTKVRRELKKVKKEINLKLDEINNYTKFTNLFKRIIPFESDDLTENRNYLGVLYEELRNYNKFIDNYYFLDERLKLIKKNSDGSLLIIVEILIEKYKELKELTNPINALENIQKYADYVESYVDYNSLIIKLKNTELKIFNIIKEYNSYNVKDKLESFYLDLENLGKKYSLFYQRDEHKFKYFVELSEYVFELETSLDSHLHSYEGTLRRLKQKINYIDNAEHEIDKIKNSYGVYLNEHYISDTLKNKAKNITHHVNKNKYIEDVYNEYKKALDKYNRILIELETEHSRNLRKKREERERQSNNYDYSGSNYGGSTSYGGGGFSGGSGGSFSGGGSTGSY